PGGNITGFSNIDISFSVKYLELLKQIAPQVSRAAVLVDLLPGISVGTEQFAAMETVAPLFGVELTQVNVRDLAEIERVLTELARGRDGGLVVTASTSTTSNR